ncbi:MAG: hypothetical protein U5L96_06020 [Owenweeksia sp.]|nr:hypothetical protein [Owenweeksia sp.]
MDFNDLDLRLVRVTDFNERYSLLVEPFVDGKNLYDAWLPFSVDEEADIRPLPLSPAALYESLQSPHSKHSYPFEGARLIYTCFCGSSGCRGIYLQQLAERESIIWTSFYDSLNPDEKVDSVNFRFRPGQFDQQLEKLKYWSDQDTLFHIAEESLIAIETEQGEPVYLFSLYPDHPELIKEIDRIVFLRTEAEDFGHTTNQRLLEGMEFALAVKLKKLLAPNYSIKFGGVYW